MPITSREIRLASRPEGEPTLDNFSFATVELPDPGPGEVLVRNLCMSVDPYMRGRMNDAKSYVPPFEIGKALQGGAVGRVVASGDEKLPVGAHVLSMFGWREAFVAPAAQMQVVDVSLAPPSAYHRHSGRHRIHGVDWPVPRRQSERRRNRLCFRRSGRRRHRRLPVRQAARLPRAGQCRHRR